jgi:hypothetical protein
MLMNLKLALVAGALAAPVFATVLTPATSHAPEGASRLTPISFSYRAAGDFSRAGRPVEGPMREVRLLADLLIMKRQVTVAE